jgi:hypothetical protein
MIRANFQIKTAPQAVMKKEKAARFDVIYLEILIHSMDH